MNKSLDKVTKEGDLPLDALAVESKELEYITILIKEGGIVYIFI